MRSRSAVYFDEISPSHCLPLARDHTNVGLQLRRLQQGNATGEIALDGLFCTAATRSRACLLRVNCTHYRAAALLSASLQLTDLDPSVANWFREEGLSEAKWTIGAPDVGALQIAPFKLAGRHLCARLSMLMQQLNGAFLTRFLAGRTKFLIRFL